MGLLVGWDFAQSSYVLANRDYYGAVTETLSIKVPRELKVRLQAVAQSRRTKPSVLLRQALEIVISDSSNQDKPSLYDLSRDLFATLGRKGPRDLSTNPKYLDDLGE
jgi:hypothetical protein